MPWLQNLENCDSKEGEGLTEKNRKEWYGVSPQKLPGLIEKNGKDWHKKMGMSGLKN